MTDEILQLMNERRQHKNRSEEEYRKVHRLITKRIKEAKEAWLSERCEEIETLDKKHDTFNVHKKIKEAAGLFKRKTMSIITDNQGNAVWETDAKIKGWKEYIEQLYKETPVNPEEIRVEGPGLHITKGEVMKAIQRVKSNKSPGPDEIRGDILKLLEEDYVEPLRRLFDAIYQSGRLPEDWLTSIFIPLPKKASAKRYEDHRIISLMSHILKIFLSIIHDRIYPILEEHLDEFQFGFRNGLGTREALFSIQVLIQRARDVNSDVFACFLDFEKAFDRVKHEKLVQILKTTRIQNHDLRIISNLYEQQKGRVKIEGVHSGEFGIQRGVRQGCVLSPLLFNIYSEHLFRDALHDAEDGISINGISINNFRYADDTVLLADSPEALQRLIDRIEVASRQYSMRLNIGKTKIMIISKNQNINHQFLLNNEVLTRVQNFTYLGCNLNEEWDHSREICIRIEKARGMFYKMKTVLCNMHLNIHIRLRVLKCYIFSTLLYGVEAWTLTEVASRKVTAFEMWCYRRMLRISWTHHVTNENVLQRIGHQQELLKTVKQRKLAYFGHIMRNEKYHILQLIMQGKVKGRRGPGRRRTSWLKNLRQWTGKTSLELFRGAVNKVIWTRVIANVQ